MFRKRSLRLLAIPVVLILATTACGESDVASSTTTTPTDASSTTLIVTTSTTTLEDVTTTVAPTTTEAADVQVVQVLFASQDQSDCSEVTAFDRSVDASADPIHAAFEALVGGPVAEETATGVGSMFSSETADMVKSVALSDGLLIVDLEDLRSTIPNASTACGSFSLLAQLNGTAFQFTEVERVSYQIDGDCDTFFNWLQRDCQEYSRP